MRQKRLQEVPFEPSLPDSAKRCRPSEEGEDAFAFWDDVGADDTSRGEPLLPDDLFTQNGRGDLLLKNAAWSGPLGRKTGPILKITGASQLSLKDNRLLIGGGPVVQKAVKMYADIVIRAEVPTRYNNCEMVRLFVSEDFASSFCAKEADIERSEGVLVLTERGIQQTELQAGHAVEVRSQHGHWRMAIVSKVPASQCAVIRHSSDLHEETVPLRRLRSARSIAIFGKAQHRLAAALRIAASFEDMSAGALASLRENPFLQGRLVGVISEKLAVRPDVMWRLNKSPYLASIKNATGCSIMFFSGPSAENAASKSKSVPYVLVAGTLEERWKGLQIVKTIATGMHERRHPALPRSLFGDSRTVRIPKDMLSVVVGKNMSAMMGTMRSTTTVILPLKESKNDKGIELLDTLMLEEGAEGSSCEIAILGEPLCRAIAELKVRALVEKHHPGYAEQEDSSFSEMDAGLGVEQLLLETELEQMEESMQIGKQLAGASGCCVEIAASRAFFAGNKKHRDRCREYLAWVNSSLHSRISGLGKRSDVMLRPKVPSAIAELPWLQRKLAKLAVDCCALAFFDMENEERGSDTRRLIFVGCALAERPRLVTTLRAEANTFIDKAKFYKDKDWSLEECNEAEQTEKLARKEESKMLFERMAEDTGKGEQGKGQRGKAKGPDGAGKGKASKEDKEGHAEASDKTEQDGIEGASEDPGRQKGRVKGVGKGKGIGKADGKGHNKGKIIFVAGEPPTSDQTESRMDPGRTATHIAAEDVAMPAGVAAAQPCTPAFSNSNSGLSKATGRVDAVDAAGSAASARQFTLGPQRPRGAPPPASAAVATSGNVQDADSAALAPAPPKTPAVNASAARTDSVAPPQTPAPGLAHEEPVAPPRTPAPSAQQAACVAPPRTPALPQSFARDGFVAPPATPAIMSIAPPKTPGLPRESIPPPSTPAPAPPPGVARAEGRSLLVEPGVAPPRTPALPFGHARTESVALPKTPAVPSLYARVEPVALPKTPALPASAVAPPKTPAVPGARLNPVSVAPPKTPAVAAAMVPGPQTPGPCRAAASPSTQTPAAAHTAVHAPLQPHTPTSSALAADSPMLRTAAGFAKPTPKTSLASPPSEPIDMVVPKTPARIASTMVPKTPAAISRSRHSAAGAPAPAPQTPAALKAMSERHAQPKTPAALTRSSRASKPAPQTPAELTKRKAEAISDNPPVPKTPAAMKTRPSAPPVQADLEPLPLRFAPRRSSLLKQNTHSKKINI
eukprot:s1251_g3.t1